MILVIDIETCLSQLLSQEDTDGDKKITVDDHGPKAFKLVSTTGESYLVKGVYHLSNLLQQLAIAKNQGLKAASLNTDVIEEKPAQRISNIIKNHHWDRLIRTMDEQGIEKLIHDTKNEALTSEKLRVYIPFNDLVALNYYKSLEQKLPITIIKLPKLISPQYVRSINNKPGILSLKLETSDGKTRGIPFVVPGGRFNEMYGWDSYFESVGLLLDGKVDLAKGMADNFQYEIEHYGKILNANRSYYLTRTQPPFYTSLIKEVFAITKDKVWLKSHLKTAIKEYETVWMVKGKHLAANGLNRYFAEGIGFLPECEVGHFDSIIKSYAEKENITIREYEKRYSEGFILNKALDNYFIHDRTVRESGHDTSYRIEGNCAHLNLVELNAMLYKYETDFSEIINKNFNDNFECHGKTYNASYWNIKSVERKKAVNAYLWNAAQGLYFDYNLETKKQSSFIAATTLTPLWANMCSKQQAEKLVKKAIPLLKEKGGIAGCTKESRGKISVDRPQRQWDYPFGWAPHQMLIWKGLLNYGYDTEAQELIYRWLFMMIKNAVDYNGVISEKYDVVDATHKVFAEYGNVGTNFEYIPNGGFGWTNASLKLGLELLDDKYINSLNSLTYPELIFNKGN